MRPSEGASVACKALICGFDSRLGLSPDQRDISCGGARWGGVCSVEENTTLDTLASSVKAASSSVVSSDSDASDSAANPDISRYVFAPIKIV
jgi:hypothetical protein